VAVASIALLACAPVVTAQDPSATPAAAGSAAASVAAGSDAVPVPAEGGPLAAGRYADTSLGREIAFDLGEGWIADVVIPEVGIAIVRDEPGAPYAAITRFYGDVFPEGCVTGDDAEAFFDGAETIEVSAAAFIDHLASHPSLTTGEPLPVEVAGLPAVQLDVTAVDVPDDCQPPWAWLWLLPVVGDYHLADGQQARVVAIDAAPEEVVVAVFESLPDVDAEVYGSIIDDILASMSIGPAAA
jgi:hypothetical protein